ncbi:hypothetical protein OQ490_04280, partial [Treponema pallidum]
MDDSTANADLSKKSLSSALSHKATNAPTAAFLIIVSWQVLRAVLIQAKRHRRREGSDEQIYVSGRFTCVIPDPPPTPASAV